MLFTGYLLWDSVVEEKKRGGGKEKKPGKTPTRGDQQKFEEFARRVNT